VKLANGCNCGSKLEMSTMFLWNNDIMWKHATNKGHC
jgi:hypothetical protein